MRDLGVDQMIATFGPDGQRVALDLSLVRSVVEGPQVQRVYMVGEAEPYAVETPFRSLLEAWQQNSRCTCGE